MGLGLDLTSRVSTANNSSQPSFLLDHAIHKAEQSKSFKKHLFLVFSLRFESDPCP